MPSLSSLLSFSPSTGSSSSLPSQSTDPPLPARLLKPLHARQSVLQRLLDASKLYHSRLVKTRVAEQELGRELEEGGSKLAGETSGEERQLGTPVSLRVSRAVKADRLGMAHVVGAALQAVAQTLREKNEIEQIRCDRLEVGLLGGLERQLGIYKELDRDLKDAEKERDKVESLAVKIQKSKSDSKTSQLEDDLSLAEQTYSDVCDALNRKATTLHASVPKEIALVESWLQDEIDNATKTVSLLSACKSTLSQTLASAQSTSLSTAAISKSRPPPPSAARSTSPNLSIPRPHITRSARSKSDSSAMQREAVTASAAAAAAAAKLTTSRAASGERRSTVGTDSGTGDRTGSGGGGIFGRSASKSRGSGSIRERILGVSSKGAMGGTRLTDDDDEEEDEVRRSEDDALERRTTGTDDDEGTDSNSINQQHHREGFSTAKPPSRSRSRGSSISLPKTSIITGKISNTTASFSNLTKKFGSSTSLNNYNSISSSPPTNFTSSPLVRPNFSSDNSKPLPTSTATLPLNSNPTTSPFSEFNILNNEYLAKWDFTATSLDEISLEKGDLVRVEKFVNSDWWIGSKIISEMDRDAGEGQGQEKGERKTKGMFPSAFVVPFVGGENEKKSVRGRENEEVRQRGAERGLSPFEG